MIFDLASEKASGQNLDELGVAADELTGAGFLTRKGWSDVILFEDDELGEVVHNVERDGTSDEATLTLVQGGTGSTIPAADVAEYEIRFDYLRDALRDLLKPMGLKGRVRELADHLHQLGVATIGLAEAPIYLGRATSVDKVLEASDRLVRGESNRIRGIVFVPQDVRFPYFGCHVVLSLRDHIDADTGMIDADVPFAPVHVEQPWRTARSPGDLTIRWTRRSRALVADAWEQVEVPLAEDLESYDVQILDGASIKRTLTSSTTSILYTAAHQTADWGAPLGPGQTLAIRIYQLSNRLGRGTPAAVTLQF